MSIVNRTITLGGTAEVAVAAGGFSEWSIINLGGATLMVSDDPANPPSATTGIPIEAGATQGRRPAEGQSLLAWSATTGHPFVVVTK